MAKRRKSKLKIKNPEISDGVMPSENKMGVIEQKEEISIPVKIKDIYSLSKKDYNEINLTPNFKMTFKDVENTLIRNKVNVTDLKEYFVDVLRSQIDGTLSETRLNFIGFKKEDLIPYETFVRCVYKIHKGRLK